MGKLILESLKVTGLVLAGSAAALLVLPHSLAWYMGLRGVGGDLTPYLVMCEIIFAACVALSVIGFFYGIYTDRKLLKGQIAMRRRRRQMIEQEFRVDSSSRSDAP